MNKPQASFLIYAILGAFCALFALIIGILGGPLFLLFGG